MRSNCARSARCASIVVLGLLAALAGPAGILWGESTDTPSVVQVEEDWELAILEADPETQAPQVTCVTSPAGNLDGKYVVFDLNLKNYPSYEAGGMQVQIWNPNEAETSRRSNVGQLLSNPGETVTWTMRMGLSDGNLVVQVRNGQGATWGSFGSGQSLAVQVACPYGDLNGYTPEVSVANSGVSFSAHRVSSLKIKKVRLLLSNGTILSSDDEHVVYQHD